MEKGVDFVGITVCYLCHDGNGNVLLNKRGKNARDEQGKWDGGGGALELGDTVEKTLRKEIKEEFCTDVLDHTFLGYRDLHREHNGKKTYWLTLDFIVLVDRNKVKNGEPHKFDDIGWFTVKTLPAPLHSGAPSFLEKNKEALTRIFGSF
ncbi:MAG TPA: NUDIX domain-containing protein [Candidatus Paceibacterota bacterium]|nr:NUDIX domain-containing protein [Candidatus Paceibacterota bacterium]